MYVADLNSIKIKLASPEEILSWSRGEVTKPETINYRTQKAEKDGLFCEKIFGPEKDYECYCGKYKGVRYKGVICDKCGVEVTKSATRRERIGHIKLACPVSHIWFLRAVPSRMGMVLDIPMQQLERVIYFANYIITKVDEEPKRKVLEEIESEYKQKTKSQKAKIKNKKELASVLESLKKARNRAHEEALSVKLLKVLSEDEYHHLSLKYGQIFEAGTGAESLRKIFEKIDVRKIVQSLKEKEKTSSSLKKDSHNKNKDDVSSDLKEKKLKYEKNNLEAKQKILRRVRMFEAMLKNEIRPEWMFMTVLPILPPDLRPMVQLDGGRYASSDLNDLYRRVINRNNRLKYLLEINAPDVIVRNEKRMLQEAVDALIDNGMRKGQTTTATTGGKRLLKSLADMLKGKQGRFRQNLLGKRVDYSGRSVIVVGPELKFPQCGLPKKMALELFKPFVIAKILQKELAYNVRGASRLIEEETEEIWAILEEVVKDKFVLLNRAPTLHKLGIQAFKPSLIEGEAIMVHPMICKAFNADFDGDQMAVHVPLSRKAQKEAQEIMLFGSNLLKPATGRPIVMPTQDMILGCYWVTKIKEEAFGEGKIFGSKNESILAEQTGVVDLRARVKIRIQGNLIETSVGRVLFNNTLPKDYPFQNTTINSKKLESLIANMIEICNHDIVRVSLDKIKELGFEYATQSGISWGMDDLIVPVEKEKLMKEAEDRIDMINAHYQNGLLSKEEKTEQAIEVWQKVKSEIEKLVPKTLPPLGPVVSIVESGARGSWSQPVQMTGMKGLVINPSGEIIELPIKSSYKEGFNVLEAFIATHGARKGTVDTALRTSTAGYLTRRLVDVAHEVIVNEQDCGDQKGTIIFREDAEEIGQKFLCKIVGRIILETIKGVIKKGDIIDWEKGKAIVKRDDIKQIQVRSPLSCKTGRGVCRKCYGWNLGNNQLVKLGEAVGVIAAQSIGEPGTQLTMRTFHTGGVASVGDITQGLPRVEEIFEKRPPKGKAILSCVAGIIRDVTDDRIVKIMPEAENSKKENKSKKLEIIEHKIPAKQAIWVEKGQKVHKGQQLCEGNLDLKELFKISNKELTQRYIVKGVQGIYSSQGVSIHDKHIEIIIRQMFSRMKIKDKGESRFSVGEIIENAKVIEENAKLKKEGKKQIIVQPMLLGVSKVAITTDSFLSAASFQETSRVLIKGAIEGKEDKLHGLKENVIIGKLIPAGTGFKSKDKDKDKGKDNRKK